MTMPGNEPASSEPSSQSIEPDSSAPRLAQCPARGEIYSPASLQEVRTGGICQAASPSIRNSKRPKTVRP